MSPRPAVAPAGRSWSAIIGLVLAVTLVRLVYLIWLCPYTLVEDEAHYWEWSRRLDWSYYSKGPGIALAIRAATELFGSAEWAIRIPAVIAGAITALAAAGLAADISRSTRVGLYAAAAVLLAPMLQAVALVSTIDGPYVACWAVACWAAWRALQREGRWAWLALGAAIAAGFLFKYTILLLIPGLALYALRSRNNLLLARSWPAWLLGAVILAAAGLAPVLIWNDQHGWPTVHHLLGHLGIAGGDLPIAETAGQFEGRRGMLRHLHEPLEFIATQFGMVGPALVIALLAVPAARRASPNRDGYSFLLSCAAPILLFYIAIAFFNEAEGNWAMGAYITLLPLAGWIAADAMVEYRQRIRDWLDTPTGPDGKRPWRGIFRRKPELPAQMLWHAAIVYGIVAAVGMLRIDLLSRTIERTGLHAPLPLNPFFGAREMAAHARELAENLQHETGQPPFIIARHYGRASVLAYYLQGTPLHVYCASSRMEGRRTQYDLWPDTNLDDPVLIGRPAVLVGDGQDLWKAVFAQVRPVGILRGDKKRGRPAFLGIEYRPATSPTPPPRPSDR